MSRILHTHGTGAFSFPSAHDGIGYIRSTIERIFRLNFNQLGSVVAVVGIIPAAARYVHLAWREASTWIKHFFIASISIPAHDPVNRSVSTWLHENVIQPRGLRFYTARTQLGRAADPGAALKKSQPVQYLPQWQHIWFRHDGKLFSVHRTLDNFSSLARDSTYDGFGGEELVISCLGLSSDPVKHFIEACRQAADQNAQLYVIIYSRDRFCMSWKPRLRRPLRRLDTVHFDDSLKSALITDIRTYLDSRTQKLYQSRSMPYRRGYLFHGPPGSGKSSLSTAIAGEFGLDLYEVKIPSTPSDGDLEQMFSEVPPRCIVLLEDIDAVWTGRDRQLSDSDDDCSNASNVTLSGLLNVLDGVGSQEGRIVIMTTNRIDELDPALTRPGRVDFKVYLGHISQSSAEAMFTRMFAPELLTWARKSSESSDALDEHVSLEQIRMLAADFAREIPENTFTPSQLQGFFQLHLNSAVRAASSIADWVKQHQGYEKDGGRTF
ncbi:hypothetical protein BST61_g2116 [Cercospora zeina]